MGNALVSFVAHVPAEPETAGIAVNSPADSAINGANEKDDPAELPELVTRVQAASLVNRSAPNLGKIQKKRHAKTHRARWWWQTS